jgi:diamine N-acetyltransferase
MLGLMYSADTIYKEINEGVIWELVEVDGAPMGYLSVTITENKVAKLNKLYVKNKFHGQGYGQQSLRHVIDIARQYACKEVFLTVNKSNVNAIKAYEKSGFIQTDAVVNDIGHGYVMDDYIYSYKL